MGLAVDSVKRYKGHWFWNYDVGGSINRGTPLSLDGLFHGKSHGKLDDFLEIIVFVVSQGIIDVLNSPLVDANKSIPNRPRCVFFLKGQDHIALKIGFWGSFWGAQNLGRCQAALKQERELKFALETARQQSPGGMSWGDPTRSQKLPSGYVKHSYWKWPFIVDFPIKNGEFP